VTKLEGRKRNKEVVAGYGKNEKKTLQQERRGRISLNSTGGDDLPFPPGKRCEAKKGKQELMRRAEGGEGGKKTGGGARLKKFIGNTWDKP